MAVVYNQDYYVVTFTGGSLPIKGGFQGKGYEGSVEIHEFDEPVGDQTLYSPAVAEIERMVDPVPIAVKVSDNPQITELLRDLEKAVAENYKNYDTVKVSKVSMLDGAYVPKLELELESVKISGTADAMRLGNFILHFAKGKFTKSLITAAGEHKGNVSAYPLRCTDPSEAGD